jgi:hypothetical protein
MQTPIEQSLNIFMNTNHLLGQLIRILYEKAKRAKFYKVKTMEKISLIEFSV